MIPPLPAACQRITLLYPFTAPCALGVAVVESLRACFARFAPFAFSLAAVRRFPSEVLYLAPDPDAPLRELTKAVCDRYPDNPQYAGKFAEVIPHLTFAQVQSGQDLDRIADDFGKRIAADGSAGSGGRAYGQFVRPLAGPQRVRYWRTKLVTAAAMPRAPLLIRASRRGDVGGEQQTPCARSRRRRAATNA
jgi:hypothetical protein